MVAKESEVYRALASDSRVEIFQELCKGPKNVEEIASALGLRSITVWHHLRVMEMAGLVESYDVRGKVGKPRAYYKIARSPYFVTFPKRQYLALTESLLDALHTLFRGERYREVIRAIGRSTGEKVMNRLSEEFKVDRWTPAVFKDIFVGRHVMEASGPAEIVTESRRRLVYRIYNCPFLELAVKDPVVMCDLMEEGFREGVMSVIKGRAKYTRNRCIAHGDQFCEFVYEA